MRTHSRTLAIGLRAALVIFVCLMLAGCGSNLTKENYEKLKEGMTQKEVEAILGKGRMMTKDEAKGKGVNMFKWGNENKYIEIEFTFHPRGEQTLMKKWEKGL
jgi:hypothetical protein